MVTGVDVARDTDIASLLESFICVPFKSSELSDLLSQAEQKQRMIKEMGLVDVYALKARYDTEADEWAGQLYRYWGYDGASSTGDSDHGRRPVSAPVPTDAVQHRP